MPLPNNSLRYVFVYVFESDQGVYLVDAGWNTDDAYAALEAGLRFAGYEMGDVRGVMVTHIHPDHYGLAGRIRAASGAWISLHPADARLIQDRYIEPTDLLERMGSDAAAHGSARGEEIATLQSVAMPVRSLVDPVLPDILLEDGERPEVPGWDLSAIWTPGHTPGHLCFWEPRQRAAAHRRPRAAPHHPQRVVQPAGRRQPAAASSWPRWTGWTSTSPAEVLPAHEHRFDDLHSRVDELRRHHAARFREVAAAIADGHTTAWDIADRMSWSRPWDEIDGWMRRAAVGEALAHLHALRHRGVVAAVETEDEPTRWELRGG